MTREHRLSGALLEECAGWIWEQLQEEGLLLSGELIELILTTERQLGLHAGPPDRVAPELDAALRAGGLETSPATLDVRLVRAVLEWEDEFLGLAGIRRAES